ncbi:hypothetical protein MTR67_032146 [Solanum verrucosum]|uniref:Uncharacterized protein n=1 Tax=Solanum verrucosum TaxID=315347 RepID=A0AAF0ZF32_SOLVR|nr:hypothetical protein MTR67_032146 [Solanum verrucosum]
MQYDDSKSQDMIERKIKNAPAGQGTVRMLTREEWESVQEVRPRTPFESKLARPNAKLRTGEPLKMESTRQVSSLTSLLERLPSLQQPQPQNPGTGSHEFVSYMCHPSSSAEFHPQAHGPFSRNLPTTITLSRSTKSPASSSLSLSIGFDFHSQTTLLLLTRP